MRKIIVKKGKNKYTWKWKLDFEDWVALCLFMAIIDYLVFQILRG